MADLTLTSPTYNATGQYGASLSGGSGQVANPIPTGGTWTLEGWVKDSARGAVNVAFGAVDTFWIGCDASNNATARYGSGGTEVALNSSTNIMDGNWHHLALVLAADGGQLFVDGVSVATSATTMAGAGASYSNNLGVRIFPGTAYAWQGEVDEVAIWSTERYTAGFTPTGPIADGTADLVSLWHLNNNGADTADVTPATEITLSGPSSGTVGVASTNFTVGANGAITGTITVTPSDSGGGGTFTPTSVNISSGTPTATFTYTAASAATHSISVTNNGGLTNPTPISYTASAGVTPIAPDNAAILYSPYNWHVNSTRAQTINPGAYFRVLFTGSTCTLNFDMSNVSSPVPRLRICVDGRTNQSANVAATVSVTMPSGQDNTTHLLEVWVDASSETINRWNAPQNAVVKLTGITLATGGDTVTAPQRRPKDIICYGDSITEGVRTLALDGAADVDRNSATVCWPLELGRQLGAEVGVVGFGFQGISNAGNGNVPNLRNAWDLLWAGQARTFTPAPDYCIWLQGHNDGGNNTQADGIAALDGMLAAMPTTQFILFRPLAGAQAANLQAIAAGCSDPSRVRYISTAGFWQSSEAPDSVHPYGWADMANVAPKMADAILTPATRTTRTVTVTLTTNGTTPAANLSGLRWAFFDSPNMQSLAAPASQGTGETTDASGVLSVSVNTTLSSGGTGWLVVGDSDGTAGVQHSGFSGPVTVT